MFIHAQQFFQKAEKTKRRTIENKVKFKEDYIMNPRQILKAKESFKGFQQRHPKVMPFMKNIASRISEGDIIELKVTKPDGKSTTCNIKVAPEDADFLRDYLG